MGLRPYQQDLVTKVRAALDGASVVMQLPTGGGKTHIAVDIATSERRRGKRIWFVCHRAEIVRQTCDALDALGVPHGVVATGRPTWDKWQVQVCSVGKLRRAVKNLTPPDIMIWDECHHVPAKSLSEVRAKFPRAKHLGLTATPARLDGKGLAGHFDQLVCGPSTRRLIEDGFLSQYRVFAPTVPDLSGIRTLAGDYERGKLVERMGVSSLMGDAVEHYGRITPGRRAVAFSVSIEASKLLVARFNDQGVPARHIDGSTKSNDRRDAIEALEAGRIKVLSNVDVFTEGFDLPAIDAVILLRPTRSLALYRQMVGRGLRATKGKHDVIILDHAGAVHLHGMPDDDIEWTLEGVQSGERGRPTGQPAVMRCPECFAVHPTAIACEACGHAYRQSVRSVETVNGALREIKRPDGCDTLTAFALRIGRSRRTVSKLVQKGLPFRDGFVEIEKALVWLSQRGFGTVGRISPDLRFESIKSFARRSGYSDTRVGVFLKEGLPHSSDGFIEIEAGMAWVEEWRRTRGRDAFRKQDFEPKNEPKTEPALLGESWKSFQDRTGALTNKKALIKAGLPLMSDGSIDGFAADKWIKEARLSKRAILPGYETFAQFCRRIGRWERGNAKQSLISKGLPLEKNGLVHIDTAMDWARKKDLVLPLSTVRGRGRPRKDVRDKAA